MFFICLIIILILITIIFWKSKLQITIRNLDISTERKEKIKKDFEIYISIIIFNKVPILKINLKKIKSKNINLGAVINQAKKLEEKSNKAIGLKDLFESLKHLEFEIKKAKINVEIGLEDAAITAISVGIIGTILGNVLKKQKFKITPIYQNKNILNLKLDCIFRVNLIHYIYKTIKKGRDSNERKSSDRRAYANSYE